MYHIYSTVYTSSPLHPIFKLEKNGPKNFTPAGHCQSKVDPASTSHTFLRFRTTFGLDPRGVGPKKTQDLLFQHMFQMKTHLNGCNCDILFFVVKWEIHSRIFFVEMLVSGLPDWWSVWKTAL